MVQITCILLRYRVAEHLTIIQLGVRCKSLASCHDIVSQGTSPSRSECGANHLHLVTMSCRRAPLTIIQVGVRCKSLASCHDIVLQSTSHHPGTKVTSGGGTPNLTRGFSPLKERDSLLQIPRGRNHLVRDLFGAVWLFPLRRGFISLKKLQPRPKAQDCKRKMG